MLEKDPERRPSAMELTKHIWFSQIEVENESVCSEPTEVSLTRTVHKIRRYNYKNKEKRARNKLKHLAVAYTTLSEVRLQFLVHDSTEESNVGDTVSLPIHEKMEVEE
jgi:serine/threonine protein kinase